jgi:GNAT superfamily N-acetyltransferase
MLIGGARNLMDLTIRQADLHDPADCSGLVDVLNSYASDPVGGGEPLSPDVRSRLPVGLRNHPTTLVLLALMSDRPVGVAICFLGFSTFKARPLLNVHDLAVIPQWRGRGIGRALLAAAETEAVRKGCCRLTLEVQDDNGRARGLYERVGFADFVVGASGPTRFLCKPLQISNDTARI